MPAGRLGKRLFVQRDAGQDPGVIFFGSGGMPFVLIALLVVGSLVFFGPLAPILLVFVLPLLLVIGVATALTRGRWGGGQAMTSGWEAPEELAPPVEFEEVRRAAQDDLLVLADDIRELDLDIELPGASGDAKEDYARALDLYERAERALDRAGAPQDLEAVSAALEEGRFAMASAKARLEGRAPPERRPPCFFDPRHGPSVRDVEWAPPDGTPRAVPACAADAIRLEEGREPLAREVVVHGQRLPYWEAPAYYGPWAGGYFGGFGTALLPALFFGSMLGGGVGLGGPVIFGGDEAYDVGADDFTDGSGGDFGGGDFGGGDFGGE
jgi:hypothetical protein